MIQANDWTDIKGIGIVPPRQREMGRSAIMIPVQYRDPETEAILERRHEEGAPAIGMRVRIGFDEYQVLFRWRCVPTSCIVYVKRVTREVAA
jgi:hypothetical protein